MRKITSLLMLLCMFVGTAWGQGESPLLPKSVTASKAPVDGEWDKDSKFYIIRDKKGSYLKADVVDANGHLILNNSTRPTDGKGYWCVVDAEEGGYSFYNLMTKKVLTMSPLETSEGASGAWLEEASTELGNNVRNFEFVENVFTEGEDAWCIKAYGTEKHYMVQHGAHGEKVAYWKDHQALYGWGKNEANAEGDAGSSFIFEPVEVDLGKEEVEVTFNYYYGDEKIGTQKKIYVSGTTIALGEVPSIDFYVNSAFKTAGSNVASMDAVVDMVCEPAFPFEFSTIDANGCVEGKWYKMTAQGKKVAYTYGSEEEANRVDFVEDNNNAKGYWAFVRIPGTANRFKIYNLGRPAVPMTVVPASGSDYNQSKVYMAMKGSISEFVVSKNGENNFNIQIPSEKIGGKYATVGNHIEGHFGFWSHGSTGPLTSDKSKLAVEEVEVTELEEAKSNAKAVWSATSWGSGFPYFSTKVGANEVNSLETFDAAIDAATTEEEIEDALEAMRTNIDEYYVRMYNVGYYAKHEEKRYLSTGVENDNKGTVATVKDGDANSWFIYSFDGKLQQENTAKYVVCGNGVGDPNHNNSYYKFTDNAADASAFVFSSTATDGQYRIYDSNGAMCSWESNRKYRVFSIDTNENWSEWAVELSPLKSGFYRLKASDDTYLSNTLGTSNTIQTTALQDVSTIYYLERGNEAAHYYLVNYQNGHYIANPWRIGVGEAKIPDHEEVYKQYMVISKNANGKYLLNYANGSVNFLKAQDSQTTYSTDAEDSGVQWTFEQVTALPVIVTAAKYATFYAPVAVQVEEGVTANTVAVDGNVATLTAIDGGVIPANTGVILNGEAGTYNFAITTATNTIESGLGGSSEAKYVKEEAYVLSNGEAGVALYKALMNQESETSFLNNGFKAYLPASAVTAAGARFITFDFGTETAIESIEGAEVEKAVVYDLSGRRVQKAQKGLYIVNGVKVIK